LWNSDRPELVTSDYVFDETVTVLKARVGHKASVAAGDAMLGSKRLNLEPITNDDRLASWEIFRGHGDKLWSYTDCTSKVLIDRLGCDQVWSLDADFRQMGYLVRP
jgi:predicted nucleic acid-binding protein